MKINILQATVKATEEFYTKSPLNEFLTSYEIDLLIGNVIIAALIIAVVMVIGYMLTADDFIAMFCATVVTTILALLSIIPLWLVLLEAILLGAYILVRGV